MQSSKSRIIARIVTKYATSLSIDDAVSKYLKNKGTGFPKVKGLPTPVQKAFDDYVAELEKQNKKATGSDPRSVEVRLEVAKQIDPSRLPEMMQDPDWRVRRVVAERIGLNRLHEMMSDKDEHVRVEVAERIDPRRLPEMVLDTDWVVRSVVARRIHSKHIPSMLMREKNPTVISILKKRTLP